MTLDHPLAARLRATMRWAADDIDLDEHATRIAARVLEARRRPLPARGPDLEPIEGLVEDLMAETRERHLHTV